MELTSLLIGTSNPGKWTEMAAVLKQLPLKLLTPADLNIPTDVEESGTTYRDNAAIKAQHFFTASGLPTLGEDSGIVVDALANELGVYTRRWGAGASASDADWLSHFMSVMEQFPSPDQRHARFISHMCLILNGQEHHFFGETEGIITPELQAPLYPGVPLSSVFVPLGANKVYSAMTEDEKNQISHRGKAVKQVYDFLKQII